jgi:hypothetical protein
MNNELKAFALFLCLFLIGMLSSHHYEGGSSPANLPPSADAGGPYSASEGSEVIFSGNGSYDPEGESIVFRWDLDNDGVWDTNWSHDPTERRVYGDDFEDMVALQIAEFHVNQTDIEQLEPIFRVDGVNEKWMYAQSFVPKVKGLSKIAVDIRVNWGQPDYELTLIVRESLSGSTSLRADEIPSEYDTPPEKWPVFDFPDIDIIANQTYYFVLTTRFSFNGTYEVRKSKDVYPEGSAFLKEEGKEWESGSADLRFMTYSEKIGLSDTDKAQIKIENLAPLVTSYHSIANLNDPRTQGYWRHQCSIESSPSLDQVGITQEYVDTIRHNSQSFEWLASARDVCDTLSDVDASEIMDKARMQLLATWLNFASDKISGNAPVTIGEYSMTGQFLDVLFQLDAILALENDVNRLEMVKDVADSINNGVGVALASVYVSVKVEDLGSDDLTLTLNWGDGAYDTVIFFNDGVSSDPYPSTNYNPISISADMTHNYSTEGTFEVYLTLKDDDGGSITILVTTISI